MMNTDYTVDDLLGKLGDNKTLDSFEYEEVFKLISADGVIDDKDIKKLKAAGIGCKEIEALLIQYYGDNDKGIIEALLDGAMNVTLTEKDLGNENTADDNINSVFI